MYLLTEMMPTLLTGAIVLMVGIPLIRERRQPLSSSLVDSLCWGAIYFLAFGGEVLVFASA